MKRSKLMAAALAAAMFAIAGCQTPSDRDAGRWNSDIRITVNGSTNVVSVTIDAAGNTLAATSRDETKTATQTTDVKPDTAVSWGASSAATGKE